MISRFRLLFKAKRSPECTARSASTPYLSPVMGCQGRDRSPSGPGISKSTRISFKLQTAGVCATILASTLTTFAQPEYATIDEAIARGDVEDVKAHLAANPETANRGKHPKMSPLQMAILRKKTEIAGVLIEAGADVNQKDSSERTPLHLAVDRRDLEALEVLLKNNALPNERDRVGWTPIHHAAAKDQVELARALLEGGADPMTLSEGGGTPLHEAAASGGAEMVQLLLDRGVDPSVVSKTGDTALAIARRRENQAAIDLLQNATAAK